MFNRWPDFLGPYVLHCHNVVHEDHTMMIRWDIVPPGDGFNGSRDASEVYGTEMPRPHAEPHPAQTTVQHGIQTFDPAKPKHKPQSPGSAPAQHAHNH